MTEMFNKARAAVGVMRAASFKDAKLTDHVEVITESMSGDEKEEETSGT